jgi:hypothetical protein
MMRLAAPNTMMYSVKVIFVVPFTSRSMACMSSTQSCSPHTNVDSDREVVFGHSCLCAVSVCVPCALQQLPCLLLLIQS